jgi:hypothetical protein
MTEISRRGLLGSAMLGAAVFRDMRYQALEDSAKS